MSLEGSSPSDLSHPFPPQQEKISTLKELASLTKLLVHGIRSSYVNKVLPAPESTYRIYLKKFTIPLFQYDIFEDDEAKAAYLKFR